MRSDAAERDTAASGHELASERVPAPVEWVLLTGDRWLVVAGLLVALFAVLSGLLYAGVVAVTNADTLTRSFAALVGGNFTLLTIVISINQLIVSQEFGSPSELNERVQSAIAYQQDVAEHAETSVTPATPDAFLDFLVTILQEEAVLFREEVIDLLDEDARGDLHAFTHELIAESERVSVALEGVSEEPFETLAVVLDAGFTADLYEARRIRAVYGESFSPEAEVRLAAIVELLEHVGVARQYLKSLYFQRELADLSRKLLYAGIPALGLLLVTTWVYGQGPTPTVQGPALDLLVVATGTAAFAPLAVFLAYVFRIATIIRRTASMVPFTIEEQTSL